MINFDVAKKTAENFLKEQGTYPDFVIDDEVLDKEYGWVFFMAERDWLEKKRKGESLSPESGILIGACSMLVLKKNGKLYPIWSAFSVEEFLKPFERRYRISRFLSKLNPFK